ncbi:hypothetical protein [Pedobacter sp. ASV28]|uniref:hypothetical protein n=1 Tax=Pedobacter sp. ASV28 TaxID=2795123 RepID=UPI0018EA4CB4|nr:hypothetical protein [Pedobacter sp. ASV28]
MSNNYANNLKSAIAVNPTFKAICEFNIQQFPVDGYSKYYNQLGNGIAILQTAEQLNTYLASYADMHQHKLNLAFTSLFGKEDFNNKSAEIIDWGCGQAFASCVLIDFIKNNNINLNLSKFTLIEPSTMALQRGLEHIDAIYQRKQKPQTFLINEKADTSLSIQRCQSSCKIKIHLFSNVLDINSLNLNQIFKNVTSNFAGLNYFVCVSPINEIRLQTFYKMFNQSNLLSSKSNSIVTDVFRPSAMKKIAKSISRVEYIFKTNL